MILSNLKRFSVFVFVVALLTSCANTAHIEKDSSTNFADYKTYSWTTNEPADKKTNKKVNSLTEANIKKAVDQELQKNGYAVVKENPDLLLTYDVLVERNEKVKNDPLYTRPYSRLFYNRFTGRYGTIYYPSRFFGYDNYTIPVKEGTVTITMIDPKSDKTVWQGWATDEISSSNITGKEIQRNVRSIFKKFDVASR